MDQLIFSQLCYEHFPDVVNHFDELHLDVSYISQPWFLCLFVNSLPWETTLRVWDVVRVSGVGRIGRLSKELKKFAHFTAKLANEEK